MESDLLLAYVKKSVWLKPVADKTLNQNREMVEELVTAFLWRK